MKPEQGSKHPMDLHLSALRKLDAALPQRPIDPARAASALEQSLRQAVVDASAAVGAKTRTRR